MAVVGRTSIRCAIGARVATVWVSILVGICVTHPADHCPPSNGDHRDPMGDAQVRLFRVDMADTRSSRRERLDDARLNASVSG
jgi:hypothetical protein